MKRMIRAAENTFTNAKLVQLLKERGIDTTKHNYELKYNFFERFEDAKPRTLKFTCPGDYLAFYSMMCWSIPDAANLEDFYGSEEYFIEEGLDEYPSIKSIKNAGYNFYNAEEFQVVHLKNMDTGEILWADEDATEEYESEEDWED